MRWIMLGVLLVARLAGAQASPGPTDSRTGFPFWNYTEGHWETRWNDWGTNTLVPYLGAGPACVTLGSAAASDDNVPILIAHLATEVKAVACRCEGTCTASVATVALEDGSGNAISLASTLTCTTGTTAATWIATSTGDADRNLIVGEALRFDVTNTPGSADWLTVCVDLAEDLTP